MSGDILAVTFLGGGLLLASSEQRSGTLLNTIQDTGEPPTKKPPAPDASSAEADRPRWEPV